MIQGGYDMDSAMVQAESGQSAANGYFAVQKKDREKPVKPNYGRTVGEPRLSEQAEAYYNALKKKYGNMEFILVSEDKKAETHAQAGQYANPGRMVVLIDEAKIERMAEDENFRKHYESIISNAAQKMAMSKKNLAGNRYVKSYGMKVNDGGLTSFFAVVDKSLAAQKKRIAKSAEKKKAEKKKAAKDAAEKRAEARRAERAEEKKHMEADGNTMTVTASSWEELLRKVDDIIYEGMSDLARTEEELARGQHFDFRS